LAEIYIRIEVYSQLLFSINIFAWHNPAAIFKKKSVLPTSVGSQAWPWAAAVRPLLQAIRPMLVMLATYASGRWLAGQWATAVRPVPQAS
jgi:hypothetical protein